MLLAKKNSSADERSTAKTADCIVNNHTSLSLFFSLFPPLFLSLSLFTAKHTLFSPFLPHSHTKTQMHAHTTAVSGKIVVVNYNIINLLLLVGQLTCCTTAEAKSWSNIQYMHTQAQTGKPVKLDTLKKMKKCVFT